METSLRSTGVELSSVKPKGIRFHGGKITSNVKCNIYKMVSMKQFIVKYKKHTKSHCRTPVLVRESLPRVKNHIIIFLGQGSVQRSFVDELVSYVDKRRDLTKVPGFLPNPSSDDHSTRLRSLKGKEFIRHTWPFNYFLHHFSVTFCNFFFPSSITLSYYKFGKLLWHKLFKNGNIRT